MTAQAQQAPNFTLNHVKGHPVSLSDYRGRTVVVTFAGRDSADQVRQIGSTLRGAYDSDQLPIISVLDLHNVPRLLQGMAKGRIEQGYQEAVNNVISHWQAMGRQPLEDMSRVVVMLPDWDGKVTQSFGLQDVDKQAVAVLIDGNGYIRGYGQGAQGGEQILALFRQ